MTSSVAYPNSFEENEPPKDSSKEIGEFRE
jgi:hypothetical protein